MKGKKEGISLITLVITIIVIIILAGAVILSMMQNNPVNKAKEAVFKTDVATYKEQVEIYHLNEISKGIGNYERSSLNKTGEGLKEVIPSIKQADIEKFEIKAGELIYIGTDSNEIEWAKEILVNPENLPEVPEEETGWNETKGVNSPALVQGMTPIKWNGSTWVDTTASDTAWYNYESKEWANAKTADGSFWVWIPRYEYQITNPHTSTAEEIKVNFIKDTKMEVTSGYIMHPAFTFGEDLLTGIWVAKFEATAREGVANTPAGDNVTTKNVKILPNVSSWRYIQVSNAFDVVRKMETDATYGWGTSGNGIDTHLMKNIEWGAVAYLSNSTYGKNAEVWINPYREEGSPYDCKTGQAGESVSATQTITTNAYTTTNGMQASTTGNITGVYDMSGGAWEYTAAYVDNGNSSLTSYGSSLINAESKYKDIYKLGSNDNRQLNYEANSTKTGDAVYETSLQGINNASWYSDHSYMPCTIDPFFIRGGGAGNSVGAGLFCFYYYSDYASYGYGFRPVLCVSGVL